MITTSIVGQTTAFFGFISPFQKKVKNVLGGEKCLTKKKFFFVKVQLGIYISSQEHALLLACTVELKDSWTPH